MYDAADNSSKSYDVAISSLRERLEKSRTVVDGCTLYNEDCRFILPTLHNVDSIVTDPPYHLQSIHKRFAKTPRSETTERYAVGAYGRHARGFMGKMWDGGDIAFDPELWSLCLDALKPGGHLLAFGGTRTYHRMACAIEDAGFEIRDCIMWVYSQGFPKSHNVSRKLKDAACCCDMGDDQLRRLRQNSGNAEGVAQEGQEPDVFTSVQRCPAGTGMGHTWLQGSPGADAGELRHGSHVRPEKSSMEGGGDTSQAPRKLRQRKIREMSTGASGDGPQGRICDGAPSGNGQMDRPSSDADRVCASPQSRSIEELQDEFGVVAGQPESQAGGAWANCDRCGKPIVNDGWGTALKPAFEPIIVARKPLSEKSVAANVLKYGTGALNIGASRVHTGDDLNGGAYAKSGTFRNDGWGMQRGVASDGYQQPSGRWPANFIHDGSEEVVRLFPETAVSKESDRGLQHAGRHGGLADMEPNLKIGTSGIRGHSDNGGTAARFFYCAKADKDDRLKSKHPTVKPIDLMAYLIRLVTQPGGTVLDPFAGSGSTGMACMREGMNCILIEREEEYFADILHRVSHVRGEDTPLFAQVETTAPEKQLDLEESLSEVEEVA
jgi:DNA modification methylase